MAAMHITRWPLRRTVGLVVIAYSVGAMSILIAGGVRLCRIGGDAACTATDHIVITTGLIIAVSCWLIVPIVAALLSRRIWWIALPAGLIASVVIYTVTHSHQTQADDRRYAYQQIQAQALNITVHTQVHWPSPATYPPNASIQERQAAYHQRSQQEIAALSDATSRLQQAGITVIATSDRYIFTATLKSHDVLYCLSDLAIGFQVSVYPGLCAAA